MTSTLRPLRVLHLLTEVRGGGGNHVIDLARAGTARGEEVLIGALGRRGRTSRFGMRASDAIRIVPRVDVVHCHGVRAAMLAPPTRAPLIVTTHGLHGLRGPEGAPAQVSRLLTKTVLFRAARIICVSDD